jgi:cyclic beta-1,2-glucan synthetase
VAKYAAYRKHLIQALDAAGWDGAWYRRAYYDNGELIGSASSDECQIDALAQAWAVLSGVASPERVKMGLDAVENRLVSNQDGMIRLLTPPFNLTPNDPGYIKGYLPGIRENGGQYTHGVLWFVKAMAECGHGTRAVELLTMLTPIWHTKNAEGVARYKTEPYVVAADVYGEPPHVGRGGWTWYTGSAGWMYRVAVESILGFTIENGDTIVMNPSISATWNSCKLKYRVPGETTSFAITLENRSARQQGVSSALMDGKPAPVVEGVARIPLLRDGASHEVVVRL